ncbi:MAG: anti-sigma factor domain-containing protein [Nocardioides sp.]|uniref:anti-sigma factor domain-containing protein n=1 Tax=Nocardioides sp. TaxID=35761 RepID=UPI003EFC178D
MTSSEEIGPHVDPELLSAVALGDDVDAAITTHVDLCPSCSAEVHALSEARALAGAAGQESLLTPPASVWDAVSAQIDADESEASPPTALAPRRHRRVPLWLATAAAAVALAVGVGLGAVVTGGGDEPGTAAPVLGSTRLTTLDAAAQDRGAAEVRRHDDRVVLHVDASDLDGPDGLREVWLINVDGTRMVSLGLLPRGETGEFDFPERLLDEGYRIVDISYEPDDGDPLHSGSSLARGELAS